MLHPNINSLEAFEAKYRRQVDPWDFKFSRYERRRYAATLGALGRAHYLDAFEPGCSIGEFTALLAPRCDRLLATDISLTAARRAVVRCAEFPGVEVKCADIRSELPSGPFELVVFSEIGYYFDAADLGDIATRLAATISGGGEFIAVHWLGHSTDHALHGDEVHDLLRSHLPLEWVCGNRFDGFRIDQWRKLIDTRARDDGRGRHADLTADPDAVELERGARPGLHRQRPLDQVGSEARIVGRLDLRTARLPP